jgi:hypothetical protein
LYDEIIKSLLQDLAHPIDRSDRFSDHQDCHLDLQDQDRDLAILPIGQVFPEARTLRPGGCRRHLIYLLQEIKNKKALFSNRAFIISGYHGGGASVRQR